MRYHRGVQTAAEHARRVLEQAAVLNGESKMDATAILDYFAPLKTWLDEQNAGTKTGWSSLNSGNEK